MSRAKYIHECKRTKRVIQGNKITKARDPIKEEKRKQKLEKPKNRIQEGEEAGMSNAKANNNNVDKSRMSWRGNKKIRIETRSEERKEITTVDHLSRWFRGPPPPMQAPTGRLGSADPYQGSSPGCQLRNGSADPKFSAGQSRAYVTMTCRPCGPAAAITAPKDKEVEIFFLSTPRKNGTIKNSGSRQFLVLGRDTRGAPQQPLNLAALRSFVSLIICGAGGAPTSVDEASKRNY